MDWWWIPIGLAAWVAMSAAVALWLGSAPRNCSQARKALDRKTAGKLARRKPSPRHRGVVRRVWGPG